MKTYHVGFDKVTRVAHVSQTLASIPTAASVSALGSFNLADDIEDDLPAQNGDGNTIFHGVRDKLYVIGELNMAAVDIVLVS